MKRLESNVTSNSASDRITNLKNKALGTDTSCNIIKNQDYTLTKKKAKDLRTFENTNIIKNSNEHVKAIKNTCISETKIKKLTDCSNIIYTDKDYTQKKYFTLRTYTNDTQEQFSSDKINILKNKVLDISTNCNITKPK